VGQEDHRLGLYSGHRAVIYGKIQQGAKEMKVIIILLTAASLMLPIPAAAFDSLGEAKALLIRNNSLQSYKKAMDLSLVAVQQQPNSFETNWVCAKAHYAYADESMRQGVNGWKEICKSYGRKGMEYAEKAIAMNPLRVEGHFWYGCSVATYSDGAGIIDTIREGTKKTQKAFETAYALDKMYEDASPVLALGRFWSVLPWPLKDKKKAVVYLEEYHAYFPDNPEGLVYLAEAYLDVKEKGKARQLLKKAAASDDRYYSSRAGKLLADM
jgi:tetratricopeptide (TPR) repeat protein